MSAAGSSAAEVSAAKPSAAYPRRKDVRSGRSSAADRNLLKFFSDGHFLSGQLRQFAAESARIRADSGGVRRSPPNVRRTFGGVRQKIVLAEVRRIRAESARIRADPRESAAEELPPTEKPVNFISSAINQYDK